MRRFVSLCGHQTRIYRKEDAGGRADIQAIGSDYQRTKTAPAIIRPRESDTKIGPTSQSRRSNFRMPDMLTASVLVAGVRTLCHRKLPGISGDPRSRFSFLGNVEGNRRCGRSVSMTGSRHKALFWVISPARVAQRLLSAPGVSICLESTRLLATKRGPERAALALQIL
jgi:hypothetical protein